MNRLTMEDIFNKLKLSKPEGKPPKKDMLYCPYCATWTFFKVKRDGYDSYPKSECCGISSEDFYVKYFNNTWRG